MTTPPTISPLHKRPNQEEVIGRLLVTLLFQSNTSIFVFLPDLFGVSGSPKIILTTCLSIWIVLLYVTFKSDQ